MEEDKPPEDSTCKLCNGTNCLTQKGIVMAYLLPCRAALVLMTLGLALGLTYSPGWLLLAAAGYMLPLVNADLRLLLYPFVAAACLTGKKANCPKCEPTGGVFRRVAN